MEKEQVKKLAELYDQIDRYNRDISVITKAITCKLTLSGHRILFLADYYLNKELTELIISRLIDYYQSKKEKIEKELADYKLSIKHEGV